jgi:polygalacturonase
LKKITISLCTFLQLAVVLFAQAQVKLPTVIIPKFRKDTFNIVKFSAVPDGITVNTKYINDAISACNKKGGGVVLIPQGMWLTGPLVIKSNVNLHLAAGATLIFTKDFSQYPLVKGNWEGFPQMRNQSPLSATGAINIAISGNGIIDGNGDSWRMVKKHQVSPEKWNSFVESGGLLNDAKDTWYPSEGYRQGAMMENPGAISPERDSNFYEGIRNFLRPNLLVFTQCKLILIEGVTFQNSPAWCLHPLMSEHITIRNIHVKNPSYAHNGDAVDVESCKNVLIENSVFDVGDDALCIKSGRDEEGRKRAIPTENVLIRNCTVYAAHGGFVIGSEMSGGARNMYVYNCTFVGSDIGLRFKTTRGRGGVVENISIRDIYMKDIRGEAILFDMYYMAKNPILSKGEKRELPKSEFKKVDETTPVFRNFHISNVYCNGASTAIFIRGLPEMHVKDIFLDSMLLQARKGIDVREATGIFFDHIKVLTTETDPVMDVTNSDHILFNTINCRAGSELMLRVSGDRSKNIQIKNTSAGQVKEKLLCELGADKNEIKWDLN